MINKVIIFAIGAALGALIGYKVAEKKYEEKLEDLERYYKRNPKDVDKLVHDIADKVFSKPEDSIVEEVYSKPEDPAENEFPAEDMDEIIEEYTNDRRNGKAPIVFLTAEDEKKANIDMSMFDEIDWTYYTTDGVMQNDNLEEIPDFQRFVGDIKRYLEDENLDEFSVCSFEYSTLYRIDKLFCSSVVGVALHTRYI